MTTRCQCRLCGEEIIFTAGNPVELGLHMIERHNSGSVVQYSIPEEEQVCPSSIPANRRLRDCPGGCRVAGGGGDVKRNLSCQKGKRRFYSKGLYKTTLETWTAGAGCVTCPSCNKQVKPLVRSQKNKVAYTSLGATFLLSCWPLCFLFPMMHKCSIDLYCPNCKYKLGVYDSKTGKTN